MCEEGQQETPPVEVEVPVVAGNNWTHVCLPRPAPTAALCDG